MEITTKEINDLKAAIIGLEKANRRGSLYGKLVKELIELYELEENSDAADFWNKRAFEIF